MPNQINVVVDLDRLKRDSRPDRMARIGEPMAQNARRIRGLHQIVEKLLPEHDR